MICVGSVTDGVFVCAICGGRVRIPAGTPPVVLAECPGPPCPHLGEQVKRRDGEPVTLKVACDSCGGVKQKHHTVHACGLFRRCLPNYRPSPKQRAEYLERPDAYARLCHGCDRVKS